MTTSMNERTHFFRKIYLSHFILKRVDVGCVWEVSWRRGQTAIYWAKVFLATIAALLPHSGWAAQMSIIESRKPSVCKLILTLASCPPNRLQLQLEFNWPKPSMAPGYIFVWHPPTFCGRRNLHQIQPRPQVKEIFRHLRPDAAVLLFLRLFTQVYFLIEGSVDAQYATIVTEKYHPKEAAKTLI